MRLPRSLTPLLLLFTSCSSSSIQAEDGLDLITTSAEGFGDSRQTAIDSALAEALTKALGALVDAELLLTGDNLQEKITINTWGIVKEYEVLEEVQGPTWEVKIAAVIQPTNPITLATLEKFQSAKIEGGLIVSQAVLEDQRRDTGRQLIEKAIDDYWDLVTVTIGEVTNKETISGIELSAAYSVAVSPQAHKAWADKYTPWFEHIDKGARGKREVQRLDVLIRDTDKEMFNDKGTMNFLLSSRNQGRRPSTYYSGGSSSFLNETSPIGRLLFGSTEDKIDKWHKKHFATYHWDFPGVPEHITSNFDIEFLFKDRDGNVIARHRKTHGPILRTWHLLFDTTDPLQNKKEYYTLRALKPFEIDDRNSANRFKKIVPHELLRKIVKVEAVILKN